jgi:hypothetical protein
MATIERDPRRLEQLLAVGMMTLFHPDPLRKDASRYQTIVRGWRAGQYVMLDRPKADARSLLLIREGQDCNVRYMIEGRACAFESRVLDFDVMRNNPYMRLRWPEQIEYTYFRRGERVKLDIPCTLAAPGRDASQGTLIDLSQGGCAIEWPTAFDKDQRISIDFELPTGHLVEKLPLVVCSAREQERGFMLGCTFTEEAHPGKDDIAFFVVSRLTSEHGKRAIGAGPRALVIDNDAVRAANIVKHLQQKGVDSLAAESVLDGFHRLMALPHSGLAVFGGMPVMNAAEITRVVRASGGFDTLPIVAYGHGGEGAGATQHVAEGPTLAADVAFTLSKLIPQPKA